MKNYICINYEIEAKMEKLDLLADKIYLHFKETKNRYYPLLLEKEKIKQTLEKIKNNSDSFYLLDKEDDDIQGICGYYIIEKEKYLQTEIFVSFNHNKKFINKCLNYFIKTYPGYTIDVGVEAENSFLIEELKNKGFYIVDDLYSATIKPDECTVKKYSDIELIELAQWDNFKEIHQKYFGEGYWNFYRIKENFDIWRIFSIRDEQNIRAYAYIKISPNDDTCEIFGIYGDNIDDRIMLIENSLQALSDKKLMYYFIEDYDEMKECKKLGFDIHGHYQAWEYQQRNK